ncbi:MAG: hypothetical protein EPO40_06475 [Myxococcaceae bacterium]|nr:MAG: hypothetical protein EPO40_06475 [Myxococcaceae bacterium]
MPTPRLESLIDRLTAEGVEFVIIGGAAAMIQGAPVLTLDLDIVHRRTAENVARLLRVLTAVSARLRADRRNIVPTDAMLLGRGHVLLDTAEGPLDVLCEIGEGQDYEWLLPRVDTIERGATIVRVVDLPTLIALKTAAGRPKDRVMLPVLLATLDERNREPR